MYYGNKGLQNPLKSKYIAIRIELEERPIDDRGLIMDQMTMAVEIAFFKSLLKVEGF